MELRGWATQNPMIPSRDMTDPLGLSLLDFLNGNDNAIKSYISSLHNSLDEEHLGIQISAARWGPTRLGIYNVILTFLTVKPQDTPRFLALTKYFIDEVKIATDAVDVTGATALYYSISTKPHVQPQFAQLLFDVGSSVNHRNRFGSTCGAEIAQVDFSRSTQPSVDMLAWYVEHGGDVDGKDHDGMNVRMLVEMMRKRVPEMAMVLERGRRQRGAGECENCGRGKAEGAVFKNCSRCKKVRYCGQECQKVDWRGHRKVCKT